MHANSKFRSWHQKFKYLGVSCKYKLINLNFEFEFFKYNILVPSSDKLYVYRFYLPFSLFVIGDLIKNIKNNFY